MRSTRLQDFQITDWLPPGVGLDDAIVVFAGLATLAIVLARRSSGGSRQSSSAKNRCAKASSRYAEAGIGTRSD